MTGWMQALAYALPADSPQEDLHPIYLHLDTLHSVDSTGSLAALLEQMLQPSQAKRATAEQLLNSDVFVFDENAQSTGTQADAMGAAASSQAPQPSICSREADKADYDFSMQVW